MTWRKKPPRPPSADEEFLQALKEKAKELRRRLTAQEIAQLAKVKGYRLKTVDEVKQPKSKE